MRTIFLFSLIFFKSISCFSQAGKLDSAFNLTGIGVPAFNGAIYTEANSVIVQADGKIIAGGDLVDYANSLEVFIMARYNADGSLDNSFGDSGKDSIQIANGGNRGGYLALQPDGKILLGGNYVQNNGDGVASLTRFNTDGSLDNSFSDNGSAFTYFYNFLYASAVALQPDGKILLCGRALIITANDTINCFALSRYKANGTPDSSFGAAGKVTTGFVNSVYGANALVLQTDGKIVLGGFSDSRYSQSSCFAMVRYNTNGMVDSSFGVDGIVVTCFQDGDTISNIYHEDDANAMAIQPDGKIILAGQSTVLDTPPLTKVLMRLVRYNINGTLDSSFGVAGVASPVFDSTGGNVNGMYLQPDGKIILACGGGIGRCNANGSIDSSFGENGFSSIWNPWEDNALSVTMQPDGKIVAGGSSYLNNNMFVARFLSGLVLGVLNFSSPQSPLLIYPNPIKGQATLQYALTQNESISLSLYDMLGRQVQTFFTGQTRTQGEHKEELQLSSTLTSGNYILSISNGHSTQGVKVTVVR